MGLSLAILLVLVLFMIFWIGFGILTPTISLLMYILSKKRRLRSPDKKAPKRNPSKRLLLTSCLSYWKITRFDWWSAVCFPFQDLSSRVFKPVRWQRPHQSFLPFHCRRRNTGRNFCKRTKTPCLWLCFQTWFPWLSGNLLQDEIFSSWFYG